MPKATIDRRGFVKANAFLCAGAAAPYFFSASKTLASETRAKTDRPGMGVIGCGGMGKGNTGFASKYCDVVAVADVDLLRGAEFARQYSGWKADVYSDYRGVLERDDVDIVQVATPDHWHTKPLVEALRAGKDVYCEKPLTLTVDEGKLIRKTVEETGRVVQVGTQQRSTFHLFVKAMALVAEGRVGNIRRITASIDGGPTSPPIPVAEPPRHLDWDAWLGPAPKVDYRYLEIPKDDGYVTRRSNGHYEFRWWYEYSGGKLTDWGAHHVDIATWALESNGLTDGPLSIDGEAKHEVDFVDGVPQQNDRYNTAVSFNFSVKYPRDVELIITSKGNGVLIEGDEGRIFVNRGKLTGKPVEDLAESPLPEGAIERAYRGMAMEQNERHAHWINFLRCVKERKQPISDVHSHMRALNTCHLAGICARLGREIKWDASAEQVVGDEVANGMLARPYREGYEIEG